MRRPLAEFVTDIGLGLILLALILGLGWASCQPFPAYDTDRLRCENAVLRSQLTAARAELDAMRRAGLELPPDENLPRIPPQNLPIPQRQPKE